MIIALTGAKGVGKDTVAALLYDVVGKGDKVKTIAFADPIKHKVMHLFGLANTHQYDLFKRTDVSFTLKDHLSHDVSGRHVVREIGMLMRSYDPDQFNTYVKKEIEKSPDDIWVITDLRFDNEYLMLREMGATIVKIVNPNLVQHDLHITERGFDDSLVDHVVLNDGSIEDLKKEVFNLIMSINKKETT